MYEYDFIDGWQHDVRLEQILPLDSRHYPACIGGRRAAPPEDCGGPWAFLELRQRHSTFRIASRMLELMSPQLADNGVNGADDGDQLDDRDDRDRAEELATLLLHRMWAS